MGYPERIAWSGKQLAYLDHGDDTDSESWTFEYYPFSGTKYLAYHILGCVFLYVLVCGGAIV